MAIADLIEVRRWDPAEVAAAGAAIGAVYVQGFGREPPVGDRFRAALARYVLLPDFSFQAACDLGSGALVGFALGYTGRPGQPWRDRLVDVLGAATAATWLVAYYEFVEFVVLPAWRRRGVGGRLHDALLAGLAQRTAVLTVRPDNAPALAFYRQRGWLPLHDDFWSADGHGPYIVMGLDLQRRNLPG